MYDLSRIRMDSGWEPRVELDEAISRTVRSLIEQGDVDVYSESGNESEVLKLLERSGSELAEALRRWKAERPG